MKYFRADKREFEPGDPIRTAGQFQSMHNEAGMKMEAALSKGRPDGKPDRAECLMLFEDEDCARKHWSKMSNGKLYTVAAQEGEVLHRGDMRLAESIGDGAHRGNDVSELARRYWEGELTDSPCVEVLVLEGVIVECIGMEAERVEEFRSRFLSQREDSEPFEEEFNRLFDKTTR